jgi:hypothetical protein
VVSDSDPRGSTGHVQQEALALLAVARRQRSVWQKMDEYQAAFSVRTEIHFRADAAIGIKNGEEAAPVLARCFFPRFLFD